MVIRFQVFQEILETLVSLVDLVLPEHLGVLEILKLQLFP
jgi:hypothetical protein